MYRLLLSAALSLSACASVPTDSSPASALPEGTWTGTVTPMNHPDRPTPITYEVSTEGGALSVVLRGLDGQGLPVRAALLSGDTLRFQFNEPEGNLPLDCALVRLPTGTFDGRCADADGRWARFTMVPPAGSS
jgi:hypothetical protein